MSVVMGRRVMLQTVIIMFLTSKEDGIDLYKEAIQSK